MNTMIDPVFLPKLVSFLMGFGIMLLNLALMRYGMDTVVNKKLVALGLPVIVLKYALLGLFLYLALGYPELKMIAFSLGLAVPVLGYVGYLMSQTKFEDS